MNKIINPYNLAEQVKINTKNISNNTMDIDELYNLVDTIPDTSGFYTKTQTDTLLNLKLEKEKANEDNTEEGSFYYSEEVSPTISKINNTNSGTQLRLLTNSIAINSIVNGNLDYFNPQDLADITTKKYVDENLNFKVNTEDFNTLNENVEENTINISGLSSSITLINDDLTALEPVITEIQNNIEQNTTNITTNTNSINTLNNLIEQSFETFGSYTSPSGSATNETIRPILSENIALDNTYVEVSVSPELNLFLNHKEGRIVFTISLSNLTNSDTEDASIGLNIYYNDELILQPSTVVPPSWSGSRTITGTLSVETESTVYVEFVIGGTLSVDAPIQYNIEYNSTGLISSPSSQITNDKETNPMLGINADLNTININTERIEQNETNITNLTNQISALNTLLTTSLDTLIPIGTLILSETKPTYGTWASLGILSNGQTIIGGSSTNGVVMGHNHPWAKEAYKTEMSHKDISTLKGIMTYDKTGALKRMGDTDYIDGNPYPGLFYTSFNEESVTSSSVSLYNIPWGIGIGTNINIWKRTG